MRSRFLGIIFIVLAAFIFGYTPILVKLSFEGGANGLTIVFLRAAISLPILAAIMAVAKIPIKLPGNLVKEMLFCASCYGVIAIFLYSSFNHISVSLAVTIHYIYPALVMLAGALFFREAMNMYKWATLILVAIGILLLVEDVGTINYLGIFLSVISGFLAAVYIIALGRSNLRKLHYLTITFYLCLTQSILAFCAGVITGELTFALTNTAWAYAAIISILISVFGVTFFQQGVMRAGSSTASLVSCLEPIISMTFGVIILSEVLTPFSITGGALIVLSVAVVSFTKQ